MFELNLIYIENPRLAWGTELCFKGKQNKTPRHKQEGVRTKRTGKALQNSRALAG